MHAEPGTPEAALLDQTGWAQPALFAHQAALAALLASYGITPRYLAPGTPSARSPPPTSPASSPCPTPRASSPPGPG